MMYDVLVPNYISALFSTYVLYCVSYYNIYTYEYCMSTSHLLLIDVRAMYTPRRIGASRSNETSANVAARLTSPDFELSLAPHQ